MIFLLVSLPLKKVHYLPTKTPIEPEILKAYPELEFVVDMNISPLTVEKELQEGIVVSVDEISARYRNLPITSV